MQQTPRCQSLTKPSAQSVRSNGQKGQLVIAGITQIQDSAATRPAITDIGAGPPPAGVGVR